MSNLKRPPLVVKMRLLLGAMKPALCATVTELSLVAKKKHVVLAEVRAKYACKKAFLRSHKPAQRVGVRVQNLPILALPCRGSGHEQVSRTIKVKVPAGIEDGMQLRYVGEGEGGLFSGPRGDLYVAIAIDTHPIFDRDGINVLCDVPISFVSATLGAKIDVPTLDGKVQMTIPSGTQSGAIFRLKEKGIVRMRGGNNNKRGDQLVKVRVEVPRHLSPRQKELLKEFGEISHEETHPENKGFFEKVRELFG